MKDIIESLLLGSFFVYFGIDIINSGLVGGGGSKTPIVNIGDHKYWVGSFIACSGLCIVFFTLFNGKPK